MLDNPRKESRLVIANLWLEWSCHENGRAKIFAGRTFIIPPSPSRVSDCPFFEIQLRSFQKLTCRTLAPHRQHRCQNIIKLSRWLLERDKEPLRKAGREF